MKKVVTAPKVTPRVVKEVAYKWGHGQSLGLGAGRPKILSVL